ncbi:MAG TPA: CBS domain-containing protein, partial [Methanoregulaceae archaeon]|nr:CBS domain-containing protein [Methanoregulaceae archaeon]
MKSAADLLCEVPLLHTDERVTRARSVLREDQYREVLVVDDRGALVGLLDISDVLRVAATRSDVTIDGFVREAPSVPLDASLERVGLLLREARTDTVAVVDPHGRVLGGVLLAGVFPILVSRHDPHGSVADLMSTRVVSVDAEDPVSRVLSLVNVTGFSAFPVMKRRQLVGMVSRRDLLGSGRSRRGTDGGLAVEAVMTTPAHTLTPDMSVREAARLLCQYDISRAPVVAGTKVVGILDRHDVLRG